MKGLRESWRHRMNGRRERIERWKERIEGEMEG